MNPRVKKRLQYRTVTGQRRRYRCYDLKPAESHSAKRERKYAPDETVEPEEPYSELSITIEAVPTGAVSCRIKP